MKHLKKLNRHQKALLGIFSVFVLFLGVAAIISYRTGKLTIFGDYPLECSQPGKICAQGRLSFTDIGGATHPDDSNVSIINLIGQDTTPPTGTIKINNDAPKVTGGTAVTLNLTATDNSGTVADMKFTNNFITSNPLTTRWSPYESYQVTRTNWNLADDRYGGSPFSNPFSTKTVWVKYRDLSLNESLDEIKDSISCVYLPTPTPTPLD